MLRLAAFAGLVLASLTVAAPLAQAPNVVPPPPDVAAPSAEAKKTASGLSTRVLQAGTSTDHPTKDDVVTVHYTGWTTDGRMFDSSTSRGKPVSFAVNRVMPGLAEALTLMVPGESRRLWIPESLAYKGQREPKGTLVFDVELVAIPNRAPEDVKSPPAQARQTPSGLSYVILHEGVGGRRPRSNSSVTVHYTGWTADGKMFDSSAVRGQPTTLTLDDVIPGWTEGLQLMVEGQKNRFWIPENLAYKGQSAPYGQLTFDIELVKIN
jgi:peptidylprolyl isomerase